MRLSSIGDVAIAVPLVKSLSSQYQDLEISVLSKPFHQFMFDGISNVRFIPFDDKKYIGFLGTFRFAFDHLWNPNFSHIIDLHNVIRTKLLRKVLTFRSSRIVVFDKGRSEKKEALANKNILKQPLKSTFHRYKSAIEEVGFSLQTNENQYFVSNGKMDVTIGIAPFSLHYTKTYPVEKIKNLIEQLTEEIGCKIILFGSKDEKKELEKLLLTPNIQLSNSNNIREEMAQMANLSLMISMDSANMHLASLVEVPVISIWGGTHPNMGFYGYRQDPENAVGINLECRPCSVFGRDSCPLGHFNCMKEIDNQEIVNKVKKILTPE